MLRITIPSESGSGVNFQKFEDFGLPAPPCGADAEINNDLILKFEDEAEAITYADQLAEMCGEINDKNTPQYSALNDIIVSIRNDEFILTYVR